GYSFANVLGGGPVHHGVEPSLELPRALTGRDHERGAAEVGHGRLKGRERAQRRIHEQESQHLAGERLALGLALQGIRKREQIENLLAFEVGKIQETFHGAGVFKRKSSPGRRTADRRALRSRCRQAAGEARGDRRWCRSEFPSPSAPIELPWRGARS